MDRLTAKTARGRVRNTTRWPQTGMDRDDVAAAFGGRPIDVPLGTDTAPPTLLAIRDIVMARLKSTGGRPALAGTDKKPRVPMSQDDWRLLEEIAAAAAEAVPGKPAKAVSPAQVAGVLVHWALDATRNDPDLRARILERAAHAGIGSRLAR
ncbi:MAG TPA: hypothetical protein VKS60_05140 [Stellaceae bacterium]|nr:hypothetical protein [Stellaceae bacterium]